MALTETKFRLSWIVLSAVFISLSASAVTEQQVEGHRCYWCGPLAEQVHRSQRASQCNGDKSKTTVCDEGLPYCAIVATSPPYVESRFCVKVYQDECYSVYCNSTKTWKITCPCSGELCNGVNTKRENEAFESLLSHNVAKLTQNKRLKRAFFSNVGFITSKKNKIDNTTIEENKEPMNPESSETIITEAENHGNPTTAMDVNSNDSRVNNGKTAAVTEATPDSSTTINLDITSIEHSESAKTAAATEKASEVITDTTSTVSAQTDDNKPIEGSLKNNTSQTNDTMSPTSPENRDKEVSGSNIQIDIPSANLDVDDLKTEIILMSSEVPKLANGTKPSDIATKGFESIPDVKTTPETKPTTVEIKETPGTTTVMAKPAPIEPKLDKNKSKSNEKLPAAEALQHTDTPTTKTTEHMAISTTPAMKTHIEATTQASMPRNNTAMRVDARILTMVIGVILQF